MKEKKYNTLLAIAVVVLCISVIALFVSSYNYFFKNNNQPVQKIAGPAAKNNTTEALRDSLQNLYAATVQNLDENFKTSRSSADTLTKDLDMKLAEFDKLKSDINNILKDKSPNVNLGEAMLKIEELQAKVSALRNRNTDVEAENKKLQALLQLLIAKEKANAGQTVFADDKLKANFKNTDAGKPANVTAAEIRFFAVATNNNKETETSDADEAEKIIGSFSIKNNKPKNNTELMVVVLQPDGKVVRNSVWESGVFETKDGKKIYSRKIIFDPETNESQFNFSLNPERFLKGEYSMQIWCNGSLIGRMSKILS